MNNDNNTLCGNINFVNELIFDTKCVYAILKFELDEYFKIICSTCSRCMQASNLTHVT